MIFSKLKNSRAFVFAIILTLVSSLMMIPASALADPDPASGQTITDATNEENAEESPEADIAVGPQAEEGDITLSPMATPESEFTYFIGMSTSGYDDYGYGAYIKGYTGTSTEIVVPEKIEGVNVKGIELNEYSLTSLDVSACASLRYLYCNFNQLESLDVSNNEALSHLNCRVNQLASLDLSHNTNLEYLECTYNEIASLDVSNSPKLKSLSCGGNNLTTLNVSKNSALVTLYCSLNQLTTLDISNNRFLTDLICSSNQISELSTSENMELKLMSCGSNPISSLDVSKNKKLLSLDCPNTQLTSLDVSNNLALTHLYCSHNQFTSLDVSKNANLQYFYCHSNQLTSLDLSLNSKLIMFGCGYNKITALDVSNNPELTYLYCAENQLTSLDISKNTKLESLFCFNNYITDTSALTAFLSQTGKDGQVLPQYQAAPTGKLTLSYTTHVQSIGWQKDVKDGAMAGSAGKGLRLEGLKLNLLNTTGIKGGIEYATHIQSIGWQKPVSISTTGNSSTAVQGGLSGTTGKGLRLEAMTVKLTGDLAKNYDVYYRVHAQSVGWMGWAKNGQPAGTAGYGLRLEALQICLVAKGGAVPGDTYKSISAKAGTPRLMDSSAVKTGLSYTSTVHIQGMGDKKYSSANGNTILGTTGKGLRLEALSLKLKNAPYSGDIKYSTHIQSIGWQKDMTSGQKSGTSGKGLRLEAIKISLTGNMAKNYDVYYRTNVQNFGWSGWAKNGQACGSAGYGCRMEAVQIVILPKGVAPGPNANYFHKR